ncbi:MAG: OmpH family outer membrane protein [Kiritimatiellae bacterium]|nr:OmpH family outer membrane protein [Kiritimatiellia bacterium]MBR2941021.1 OmpH family outer membrane protein [Kiritimatiellia bacterium]
MKKTVFVLVATLAMAASAELKLGTVDMMLLVKNHPNYESNKALLESTDKDYKKKLEGVKSEGDNLQTEGKKLMDQMRNPMLTAKAKADIEKQIGEIQQKLIGIEQRYRSEALRCRQDLQDLEGRLLRTTTDDLRKRINKYAEANGFDLVIDQTAAAYAKKSFDVTDDLLKDMGVDPENAKGRDEGK